MGRGRCLLRSIFCGHFRPPHPFGAPLRGRGILESANSQGTILFRSTPIPLLRRGAREAGGVVAFQDFKSAKNYFTSASNGDAGNPAALYKFTPSGLSAQA